LPAERSSSAGFAARATAVTDVIAAQ